MKTSNRTHEITVKKGLFHLSVNDIKNIIIEDAGGTARHILYVPGSLLATDFYQLLFRKGCISARLNAKQVEKEISTIEKRKKELYEKALNVFENVGLREASSSWAPVSTFYMIVKSNTFSGTGESAGRSWSSNGKWSGLNARLKLYFNYYTHKIIKIAGVHTIVPNSYKVNALTKCWTFKQGRGFDFNLVEGYVYKNTHVENVTDAEKAMKRINNMRRKAAETLVIDRIASKVGNIKESEIWVEFSDSTKAGNCEVGTKQFLNDFQKITGSSESVALRADYLIELRNDTFVARAIAKAKDRIVNNRTKQILQSR